MSAEALPIVVCRAGLDRLGLSKHRFYGMVRTGEFEQIGPGFYARAGALDDTTATLASIACRKPSATICLLSSLALHDLTDEIPRASDIALPRGERTPTTRLTPVRWHSFDTDTFELGRDRHQLIEGITIGLYSAERTIIDLFRLRHEIGADIANEALKRWLRRRGSTPASLLTLARSFPKALPRLRSTLEILL